jgi:hypothetical protein
MRPHLRRTLAPAAEKKSKRLWGVNELFFAVFVIIFPPPGLASHYAVPKPRFTVELAGAAPIFTSRNALGTGSKMCLIRRLLSGEVSPTPILRHALRGHGRSNLRNANCVKTALTGEAGKAGHFDGLVCKPTPSRTSDALPERRPAWEIVAASPGGLERPMKPAVQGPNSL